MPSKKKKYNARFPAGRIKKIMQTDEEVGKVAQAVPVIISRTLELFVESLLTKTLKITNARNAKTLSPSHMKQCIISESRFDFLRDLVKNIPDIGINEELSGSETGYGNEATSPASTSTSSSNGGGTLQVELSGHLQRSESYTPTGSSYSQQLHTTGNSNNHKRTVNPSSSLNFYKEISLDDSSATTHGVPSYAREPPPKLSRINSAPAGTSSVAIATLPYKIDILPTNCTTTVLANHNASPTVVTVPATPITYKIEPFPPSDSNVIEPVIKLDYSNLKLPMINQDGNAGGTTPAGVPSSSSGNNSSLLSLAHQSAPTIKIDLSCVTNIVGGSSAKQQVPSMSTTNISGNKNPYTQSQAGNTHGHGCSSSTATSPPPLATAISNAVAPVFSSLSSTIPGMDEDYDDI